MISQVLIVLNYRLTYILITQYYPVIFSIHILYNIYAYRFANRVFLLSIRDCCTTMTFQQDHSRSFYFFLLFFKFLLCFFVSCHKIIHPFTINML
jgi:hypothetical protein